MPLAAVAVKLCGLSAMVSRPDAGWQASRMHWHLYYAARFNKTGHPHAAQLSLWYLFLYISES